MEITARQTALALDPPVPEEAAEEGETEEELEALAVITMNSCQDYFTPVPSFFSSLCSTLCAIQDSGTVLISLSPRVLSLALLSLLLLFMCTLPGLTQVQLPHLLQTMTQGGTCQVQK